MSIYEDEIGGGVAICSTEGPANEKGNALAYKTAGTVRLGSFIDYSNNKDVGKILHCEVEIENQQTGEVVNASNNEQKSRENGSGYNKEENYYSEDNEYDKNEEDREFDNEEYEGTASGINLFNGESELYGDNEDEYGDDEYGDSKYGDDNRWHDSL